MLGIKIKGGEIQGLREVNRVLNKLGDDSVKELRTKLRAQSSPYIKGIRSFIKGAEQRLKSPGTTTPNGMNIFNNGKSSFTLPTVSLEFKPSKYKGSIVSIKAFGRNKTYGYDIIEKAGTHALTGKGLALAEAANRRLNTNKPGRLAYRAMVGKLPELRKDMTIILDKWTETLSAKLKN